MILKLSEKTNSNGWRRQIIIDFENKTITTGSFLFLTSDIDKLTHAQYLQFIDYFLNNDFTKMEK